MLEYRITKYNPAVRDPSGSYTRDEWTSISDIGRSFGGVVLTPEEYHRVEDAYVAVALSFLREAGQSALAVSGLENNRKYPIEFCEGSFLGLAQLGLVIRLILREKFWCRLEGPATFLHFGWDYYMYAGVPCPCPASQELAKKLQLFVEEPPSPYKREEGAQGSGTVCGQGVIGKQVQDARLVADCHVHAVTHVLTFNIVHFARLAGFGPGVVVIDPASV